jgi:hypothetical protein
VRKRSSHKLILTFVATHCPIPGNYTFPCILFLFGGIWLCCNSLLTAGFHCLSPSLLTCCSSATLEEGSESVSTQLAEIILHALSTRAWEIGTGSRHDELYLRRSGMASAQHQAVTSEACRPVNQWKSSKSATNYPFVYFLCLPYLGGDDLNLEPLRDVKILPAEKPGMRVGLVDCGLPLCRTTWTHAQFSWEIDPRVKSRATTLPECPHPNVSYESVSKSPAKLLKSNAVDPLVIDHSRHDRAASFNRCGNLP